MKVVPIFSSNSHTERTQATQNAKLFLERNISFRGVILHLPSDVTVNRFHFHHHPWFSLHKTFDSSAPSRAQSQLIAKSIPATARTRAVFIGQDVLIRVYKRWKATDGCWRIGTGTLFCYIYIKKKEFFFWIMTENHHNSAFSFWWTTECFSTRQEW